MYQCPKCKSENLDVCVRVWARVEQANGQIVGTDTGAAHLTDHEWDDASGMYCRECGHIGQVRDFDTIKGRKRSRS